MAADNGGRGFGRDSVEFARVLTFSDGMFAIAMTLLVVGIEVPDIPDTESVGELADALGDLEGSFVSFFISFAVIGRYWIAHHQFFSLLARMDSGLIGLNLIYLCFVAFLPFPTGLFGNFFENPLAFTIYAVAVAVVSGMELVMFRCGREARAAAAPDAPGRVPLERDAVALARDLLPRLNTRRVPGRQRLGRLGLAPDDSVPSDRGSLEARGHR